MCTCVCVEEEDASIEEEGICMRVERRKMCMYRRGMREGMQKCVGI